MTGTPAFTPDMARMIEAIEPTALNAIAVAFGAQDHVDFAGLKAILDAGLLQASAMTLNRRVAWSEPVLRERIKAIGPVLNHLSNAMGKDEKEIVFRWVQYSIQLDAKIAAQLLVGAIASDNLAACTLCLEAGVDPFASTTGTHEFGVYSDARKRTILQPAPILYALANFKDLHYAALMGHRAFFAKLTQVPCIGHAGWHGTVYDMDPINLLEYAVLDGSAQSMQRACHLLDTTQCAVRHALARAIEWMVERYNMMAPGSTLHWDKGPALLTLIGAGAAFDQCPQLRSARYFHERHTLLHLVAVADVSAALNPEALRQRAMEVLLAEPGIDLDAVNGQGECALEIAARRGDVAISCLLLKAGAQCAMDDPKWARLMTQASKKGHSEVIALFAAWHARTAMCAAVELANAGLRSPSIG
jgi:hypothetical protein